MARKQATQNEKPKNKRYFIIYAYMLLILLVLTTVATYAWFSLSANPRVSNLSFYISSAHGMEISIDPVSGWSQRVTYEDVFGEAYELRPVTYSQKLGGFFGMVYLYDGTVSDTCFPLFESIHANSKSNNYYCVGTLYARTGANTSVSLAPALALNDTFDIAGTYLMGKPKWNETEIKHDNLGRGAENAIRIAIEIIRLKPNLEPTGETEFFIYEPNADRHNDGTVGYLPTPSIDGTPTLIDQDKIITQSASSWTESDLVERDKLVYQMGSFDGDTKLFKMKADEIVKIKIYIWLEGQDVDCTNVISSAHVIANIQFSATTDGGGGLTPIPPSDEEE